MTRIGGVRSSVLRDGDAVVGLADFQAAVVVRLEARRLVVLDDRADVRQHLAANFVDPILVEGDDDGRDACRPRRPDRRASADRRARRAGPPRASASLGAALDRAA